jgi:hypothetical protein
LLSAYVERDKNFFRKIEICYFLLAFFVENWAILDELGRFFVLPEASVLVVGI